MAGHNESKAMNHNVSSNSQDFIPFNSPPQSGFSPSNYSSPVQSNNYRNKQWKQNYSSPFNQHKTSNRYSNPYNRSSNNSRNISFHKKNHSGNSQDISSYLHPSFTEDPWEKLESELKRKSSG